MEKGLRVLVAGGCHVAGFPVGEKNAFAHAALECLSEYEGIAFHTLPLLTLRSGPQIVAACRDAQADVIVLQLGHYETPRPLLKCLGLRRPKRPTIPSPQEWPVHSEARYRVAPSTILVALLRIAAAVTIVALGRKKKMFNPAAIADSLDALLGSLEELPLRGIVLLSPFPAPDPVRQFFRRRLVPIFEAAAKKHGCIFVNVFKTLEADPEAEAFRANFVDLLHLSVLGHQRVGLLVGAALKGIMEPAGAAEIRTVVAAARSEGARAAGARGLRRPAVAVPGSNSAAA